MQKKCHLLTLTNGRSLDSFFLVFRECGLMVLALAHTFMVYNRHFVPFCMSSMFFAYPQILTLSDWGATCVAVFVGAL